MQVIRDVLTSCTTTIPSDLSDALVRTGVFELTTTREPVAEWQLAASEFLIALGGSFCHDVAKALLDQCKSGEVPNYYVVKTFGDLAAAHRACSSTASASRARLSDRRTGVQPMPSCRSCRISSVGYCRC